MSKLLGLIYDNIWHSEQWCPAFETYMGEHVQSQRRRGPGLDWAGSIWKARCGEMGFIPEKAGDVEKVMRIKQLMKPFILCRKIAPRNSCRRLLKRRTSISHSGLVAWTVGCQPGSKLVHGVHDTLQANIDVENPASVDDFHRETMGFLHLC